MKYIQNIKSFLSRSKPKLNIKNAKPPTKDTVKFKSEDVIETLNDVLCVLDDYNIDIQQPFVDKFTTTISKDKEFFFFDIKEKVLFALEMIDHNFLLNEVKLCYTKEGALFTDSSNIIFRLIPVNLYGKETLDKIEEIKNFKITALIIDFYLS